VPLELQYWTGSIWARNTIDACTALAAGNFGFTAYPGGAVTSNAFAGGAGSIKLTKPSDASQRSVDVAVNLGSGGSANSCTAGAAFTPAATAGNRSYLRSQQTCGADRDPSARATFGIYNNKFIFRREVY
jgi:MSHA biogenesis protein MshQ